jgi:hypothetical protein
LERPKIVLTGRDKRILYAFAVLVLVVAALAVLVADTLLAHSTGVKACMGILLPQSKQACLQNIASSTGNVSVCSYIPGAGMDSCISEVAEAEGNLSMCGRINSTSPYYDACVYNISYASNSLNGCGLITNPNYRSSCIYALAEKLGFSSASYCSLIPNSSSRSICLDMYYYNLAVSSRNATYCVYLPPSVNDTLLYAMTAQQSAQSGAFSYNVTLPLYYSVINATPQGLCYYRAAIALKNESLCNFAGSELSTLCTYSFYAPSVNSTLNTTGLNASTICAKAPSYLQQYCKMSVQTSLAVKYGNASICLSLGDNQFAYSCINTLARSRNSTSYCNYIQNLTARSACILMLQGINVTK